MGDIKRYRKVIKEIIESYAKYKPSVGEVEVETIFDESKDHYELIYAGWSGPYRIHGSAIHIDIRNGKVCIQCDGTEEGVAEELLKAGIPREHIVLGFKSPEVRQHTGFAVA